MVATPQTFVATTIGRVAIPKLADTLVKTGADKFIKQNTIWWKKKIYQPKLVQFVKDHLLGEKNGS